MYPLLKTAIKDRLKQKGLGYKELGRHLGISEAGVKKLFQAEDCSLSRLKQITEILEIDLAMLILEAEKTTPPQIIEIDPKVQAVLQKDPQMMDVFWLLFIEDLSPHEILERYQISRSSLYRCLQKLDKLKLIVWNPDDQVKSGPRGSFLVKPNGPLIQDWIRRFSSTLIDDFYARPETKPANEEEQLLSQRLMSLKPETARELRQRLADLIREFDGRSVREKTLSKTKTVPTRLFVACSEGSTIKRLR